MAPGNHKANRRTPFDDDLVTDPDAARDTRPLPRGMARPVRPSRLLPPRPGTGTVAPGGPADPNYADDNDTGALSGPLQPAMARRIPLSAIIGLSMVGGALAVVVISTMVSRALPRPDLKGEAVITAPTPDVIMEKPTDIAPASGAAAPADNTATAPAASATVPPALAARTSGHNPSDRPDSSSETTASGKIAPSPHDELAPTGGNSPTDRARDKVGRDNAGAASGSAERDTATPEQHRGDGYAITPPPQFKLVHRGRRTVWSGPDGAHLLVETTSRPSRSPFGDWLILDQRFRKAYGPRYRSSGITPTTLAGRPAAMWDFELDTKTGTLRKLDVAVHANGRGYAVLGSAPLNAFDALRPRLESAINSFELRDTRRRTRGNEADNSRPARAEGAQSTGPPQPGANNRVQDDLRPDMGY